MTDKDTLKQALKAHYQKNQLSDRQLAGLKKLQQNYQPEPDNDDQQPSQVSADQDNKRPLKLAAALFVTLLVGFLSGHFLSSYHYEKLMTEANIQAQHTGSPYNTNSLIRDIAEEITFNHRKLKPLEIETNRFEDLVKYFSMLDFRPYLSSNFTTDGQLIGGRYCSIGSVSAVQFRFENDKGEITTLYQTAYSSDSFKGLPDLEKGEDAVVQYLNGYQVALWVEMGIVMASVTSPE